jgi:hypothetical protein
MQIIFYLLNIKSIPLKIIFQKGCNDDFLKKLASSLWCKFWLNNIYQKRPFQKDKVKFCTLGFFQNKKFKSHALSKMYNNGKDLELVLVGGGEIMIQK